MYYVIYRSDKRWREICEKLVRRMLTSTGHPVDDSIKAMKGGKEIETDFATYAWHDQQPVDPCGEKNGSN